MAASPCGAGRDDAIVVRDCELSVRLFREGAGAPGGRQRAAVGSSVDLSETRENVVHNIELP
eukprot:11554954-Alexandrium_andersonii.AAC.1